MTAPTERSEIETLTVGAQELGIDLTEAQAASLLEFLSRFYSWNRFGGFTRIPREHGVRLHLLDSLAVVQDLSGARSIVDLGTGGGMPGIPLALVLRGSAFTLVESRGRRCTFLREVVREGGLIGRVEVVQGDAHDLVFSEERFDAVVSRAFLPPKQLLTLGSKIIRATGRVIVMGASEDWLCGSDRSGLAAETRLELKSQRSLVLPAGGEVRRVFRFERRIDDCFT